METIKSCTDISQSKILRKILSPESADMYYPNRTDIQYQGALPIGMKHGNPLLSQEIPAWSLSALLGLMPKLYELENDPDDAGCQPNLCKGWDNNLWHIVYRSTIYITEWYDEPIDAAFEMICWLKENNKL